MRFFLIGVVFLILLTLRFFFFYQNTKPLRDGDFISFHSILFSEPRKYQNYQRLEINYRDKERIFVFVPLYPEYHYGDSLKISGSIEHRLLNNGADFVFMNYPKIEAVKSNENYFLALISLVRQKIISLFQQSLPVRSSSLLLGIVFGIKDTMPKEFLEKLKSTGVMHVVAASGMNVTLVGGFISSVLVLFLKRRIALIASIFAILFYAVLSGLEPSIIRAAIMGVLAFSAQILGRQRQAYYALLLTGYGMLFLRPSLLFDIGFQLSFLSTAGLLYIKPFFEVSKISLFLSRTIVGEEAATTISAQLFTLPILIANFGTYSLWSVLVNALVLWTVPILMVIGGIGAIFGILIAPLGQLFLFLSVPLLLYFEAVIGFFANRGIIRLENISWTMILGYYLVLFSLVYMIRKRKQ